MKQETKYIGTIIKGDKIISKSNKKVIFKVNNNVYVKKIKEKWKIRRKKYVIAENVNIICNNLSDDYVLIDSDNQPYFNKMLLILIVLGIFIGFIAIGTTMMYYEKLVILSVLGTIGINTSLIIYFFLCCFNTTKKTIQKIY